MKALILVLGSQMAFSYADTCSLFELNGRIKATEEGIVLEVASRTLSEKLYPFHIEVQNKVVPYLNDYVSGQFLLSKAKIVSVSLIKEGIIDPLSHNENSEAKKLKDGPCPEF